MLGIIRKDILWYAALFVILAAGPILLTYLDGMTRGTIAQLVLGMLVGVVVAMVGNEFLEVRMEGYKFLAALPILAREIVTAKHLLVLFFVLLNVAYGFAFIVLAPVSPQFSALSAGYLVLAANGCLLLCAAVLYFLYRSSLSRAASFPLLLLLLVPAFLLSFVQLALLRWARRGLTAEHLLLLENLATPLNLVLLSLAGLGVYWSLMRASVRALERKQG